MIKGKKALENLNIILEQASPYVTQWLPGSRTEKNQHPSFVGIGFFTYPKNKQQSTLEKIKQYLTSPTALGTLSGAALAGVPIAAYIGISKSLKKQLEEARKNNDKEKEKEIEEKLKRLFIILNSLGAASVAAGIIGGVWWEKRHSGSNNKTNA